MKYEGAEVDLLIDLLSCKMSEIMGKTIKNGRLGAILDFISMKFVTGYPCVTPYILFYIHGPAILHFLGYITKLLKFKMAAKRQFCNCFFPKVNQVIG